MFYIILYTYKFKFIFFKQDMCCNVSKFIRLSTDTRIWIRADGFHTYVSIYLDIDIDKTYFIKYPITDICYELNYGI